MKNIFLLLVMSLFMQAAYCQKNIPLLKSYSKKIAIKDGDEPVTKYWNHLSDTKFPLIYKLSKLQKTRTVNFYTDVDSISFKVSPNGTYTFKVLLNSKDTCCVLLSTVASNYYEEQNRKLLSIDTIPFTFGKDNKIHLSGSLNGVISSDFVFDTGANHLYVIGDSLDKKFKLELDGFIEDESITGFSTEKTSSKNNLQLNHLKLKDIPLIYIDAKGFVNECVLIGYNIFEDKVIEVNYDNQQLIIHQETPPIKKGYSKMKIKNTTGGTYLELTLQNNYSRYTGWFLFDTGADFALSASGNFVKKNNLAGKMEKTGTANIGSTESGTLKADIVTAPNLIFGGVQILNVPLLLAQDHDDQFMFDGIIGFPLLKKFNTIIDYPNASIYLKPNTFFEEPFINKKKNKYLIYSGVALIGLIILMIISYKRRNFKH